MSSLSTDEDWIQYVAQDGINRLYPGGIADCAHVFGRDAHFHGELCKNSFTTALMGPIYVVEQAVEWL